MPAMSSATSQAAAPDARGGPAFSPLYRQIKGLITASLQSGEWKPGEAIPSEIELAARFKVSQGTVRKAIDELATENLLVRRQGKGTFVATHAEERTQYRFLRLVPGRRRARGQDSAASSIAAACARPPRSARALDLKSGDAAIQVQRLLSFRGTPVVLDDIWLPGALFKGLTAERLSDYRGPLYRLFEAEFGVRMIRAEEKIRAVAADADAAALLQLPAGAPLLSVERLSMTYGDRPVEVRRGLYNTASHYYRNELS